MSIKYFSTILSSCSTGTLFSGLLVATLTLWYFYIRISKKRFYQLLSKIDGPKGLPLLGNALDYLNDPHRTLEVWWRKSEEFEFRNPFKIWIGPISLVFLSDPKDIEVILSSPVHIDKPWHYDILRPWIGEGLLVATGEKWRAHRKLIAPTFHLNVVKHFVDTFNRNSRDVVEKLKELGDKEFDAHKYMVIGAIETLLESVMGVNKKTQTKGVSDYASAIMKMYDIVHMRHRHILYVFDTFFKFSKHANAQDNSVKTVHNFSNKTLETKKSTREEESKRTLHSKESSDSLDLENIKKNERKMNKSEKAYNYSAGWKDELDVDDEYVLGEKKRLTFLNQLISAEKEAVLNAEEVKEEVDTIMFEGHDTVAATSSFFLCVMGARPDIQEKVFEEIDAIFKGSDRSCTFRDTLEMKFLERCIMETLRMYPPVPVISRQIKEEIKLPSTNAILPAECVVAIPIYKIHQDPTTFPNPEKFDPDNFLSEKSVGRHYYSFIPFSAGPRSCVGRKYAMLTLKILLSNILRNFRVRSAKKQNEWPLQADIILKRSDGFQISLQPRNKNETLSMS